MAVNGKKGIFYIFIAVIFLMAIGAMFTLTLESSYESSQDAVESRVKTMNDFIQDLNNDMGKATYIAAYRSLIAMEEQISLQGDYFNDSESVFREAFYNGTINGENKTVLNASSFSDYLKRVNVTANDIGVELKVDVQDVTLYHQNPWNVMVQIVFKTNLTDKRGLASWGYERTQETKVSITSLRDPVYIVGTNGRVPNTIHRTNYTRFINDTDDANDTTNLMAHTNSSFYIASKKAPSYVMRLEGNFSNSTYGIESLVDVDHLQSQGLTVKEDRSIVDHIYFPVNLTNASVVCDNIINTPGWFKIDEPHLTDYEINPKLNPEGEGYEC